MAPVVCGGRVVTRLMTVLVTLAVPEEADVEDAAVCTALEVVSAAGVEGHLPVPGSLVQHGLGNQPWRVAAVSPAALPPCATWPVSGLGSR